MGKKRPSRKQVIRGIERVERELHEEVAVHSVKSRMACRRGDTEEETTHDLLAGIAEGVARMAREMIEEENRG